jgi:hypothetical protein
LIALLPIEDRIAAGGTGKTGCRQLAMHGLDDIAPLAQPPQLCVKPCIDLPTAGSGLFCQSHPLERSQPPHPRRMPHRIPRGLRTKFKSSVGRIAQDGTVETCEPFCRDFLLKLAGGLDRGLWTKLPRYEVRCPRSHPVRDVVPGNHEVVSFVVPAADHDVAMRMPRVEMIGRDPVELRAKILFHLPYQVADKRLQVRQLRTVLWCDDEPELVAIASASFCERLAIGTIARGVIQLARLSITRDAVTLNVSQVRPDGTPYRLS